MSHGPVIFMATPIFFFLTGVEREGIAYPDPAGLAGQHVKYVDANAIVF